MCYLALTVILLSFVNRMFGDVSSIGHTWRQKVMIFPLLLCFEIEVLFMP